MKTQRIAERGKSNVRSHFNADYHSSALNMFSEYELWEKTAGAMAYAIENQDIYVYPEDRIGGRIYHKNEIKPIAYDPDLDCDTRRTKYG